MADSRENHRQSQPIRRSMTSGSRTSPWLDDGGGARFRNFFYPSGKERTRRRPRLCPEWEVRPSWRRCGRNRRGSFVRRDADALPVARVNNGVGFNVLGDLPGEQQKRAFPRAWADVLVTTLRSSVAAGACHCPAAGCHRRHFSAPTSARRCLTSTSRRFFFAENRSSAVGSKPGAAMASTKSLPFLRRCGVDDAIDADDTSECGDWIALEGLLVSIHQFRGRCRAAWVGVLDDGADGFFVFLRQIPRGLQVNDVVVGKLLALDLTAVGDSCSRAIAVHGSGLVGILSVAQIYRFLERHAQGLGESFVGSSSNSSGEIRSSVEAIAES